ncbi:PREDICTED: transcription factor SPT20 homolog isoform X1 [Vollenhovia emeryi]|uniref:transcription factor SPT20 homolog isoform X1 n=1 Tax=Vollenhovia emeryi TaxID=411798 RepID=UPI0005F4E4BE|nr:PREDICTED: transcription factor SPT20 homolog isoform X1 [Vollenhovia emeryi]XP_011873838.1 PREDICTED: transcription factor SPT20 homolog isoform X1 [Vollenhovia emeryi]XP_011873839.1 PREDICTED: transcription factor SPT20 homolog isoform X1 [Vollenhovia emeryi]XP_011873840.1 PREDICTED: transcription factor SPT20 homolog isoform X1 [Vollenhovia emeryi]XP_011873841.1 PREDICTED: transcription factor SPT20 homolog isoform X1 [Vollenhovia emeryi]XP_011873842.1 PREDICTED: transcription factor SPT
MISTACTLEDACRQAQGMISKVSRSWKNAQGQNSLALTSDKSLSSQRKEQSHSRHSIQSKLTRLYFEDLSKVPHATPDSVLKHLENECDLLGRLVQREGLDTLIVNLYAGNKGYSLAVRNSDKGNQYDKNSLAETQLMGYEQGELLSCIDNGQLPAMLAEQLESTHSHLFYDGCVIAEVRDYRRSFLHNKAEVHHVLLKPTTQSVLSDVSTLTSDGDWSHEERLILESHLVAATQGPLCLDPNPIPTLASTRIKQSKSLLTDHQLIRQAKKFSQVTVNRKRKLEQLAQPEGQTIHDLMQKFRTKRRGLATNTACPPPSLKIPELPAPSETDVLKFAKIYKPPQESRDCSPQVIEEYILEPAESQDYIKLSILQRPATSEYLGELYMDKNHRDGERNGSSCRFTLGTRAVANHYYQQFKEIFTEEGRKNVRIKHIVPGQAPRIACTSSMQRAQQAQQAKVAQLAAQQLQQVQPQHVAQQQIRTSFQILSRAQGQLTNLASQVASMKAMTEATTSAQNNLTCVDSANIPQVIPQNDITSLSSRQSLANGGLNTSTPVQIENSTMAVADNTCNGSGILVFQKSAGTINNTASTNVPVLQAQLQAGTQNCISEANQSQSEPPFKKHSTNPAISALVTSLMNSAQQFQQQAAANAAAAAMNNNAQATNKSNNAAILSLLNSTPANIAQRKVQPQRISLNASIPPGVISHGNVINVPNTSGQVRVSLSSSALTGQLSCKQQPVKATAVRLARVQDPTSTLGLSMPGLSALLAGTPSADNPIPGMNSTSSLLERLTASSSQSSQPASPMTSPSPTNVNLQGVNLTSLPNSINGLQNVQVSFPGLSQPITMSLNVSPTTGGTVTPTGVIVSLPISSATNTCTTVSSMVAATVVTTAIAGTTPTVVIANPANHLSLPIAQIIPSGVKGLSQQNIRSNNAVTLAQGGQAIQLIGSQRPRFNHMTRQVQSNQVKSAVLSNQLVTVAKTVTANQLILSGNKQVLTPIVAATKPVLMASQTTPSSQVVPVNKQTLLTKSLHARASTGQCSQQTQSLGVATLSRQQLQQLQQCLAAQHKVAVAAGSSQSRTQIEAQRNSTSAPGEDPA